MENRLKKIRQEIDKVDDELIARLTHRMQLARELGKLKAENHLPIHDPEREEFIINRLSKAAGDYLTKDHLRKIYKTIFSIAQDIEYQESNASVIGVENSSKDPRTKTQ